jgi:hypothetical protein
LTPIRHRTNAGGQSRTASAAACKEIGQKCPPGYAVKRRPGNQGDRSFLGDGFGHTNAIAALPAAVHTKPIIGRPGDDYEREADWMADVVMRLPSSGVQEFGVQEMSGVRSAASIPEMQRSCAECDDELGKNPSAQLRSKEQAAKTQPIMSSIAASIHALRGRGGALPAATRALFEPRFGRDFGNVRVHTDGRAAEAAKSIHARAFTIGNDIVFGAGQYSPTSGDGQKLLAHELTHVVQQQGSGAPALQRKDKDDEKGKEKPPAQSGAGATRYKQIRMRFDGSELIVYGDGAELFRYGASSGRPIMISEKDARECGGDPRVDTYMSARFAGIEDHGPIPEGTFQFQPPQIQKFSTGEQLSLLVGGIVGKANVTVQGQALHPGDWGSGRVPLNKVRVEDAPCGNPHKRTGFFLHGGLLAGSSGCIDIGGNFDELSAFLRGYQRPITVDVHYETTTPRVGFLTGLGGAIAYKGGFHFRHGPTLRTGVEFGEGGSRFVASGEYQAVLAWAGGALSAGLHLDIPMTSQDAFVRAGLRGGAEFRLLNALYGQLIAGGFVEPARAGAPADKGVEVGGGLRYDLGPVQLSALYNHLQSAARQDRNQVLVGLGFRW